MAVGTVQSLFANSRLALLSLAVYGVGGLDGFERSSLVRMKAVLGHECDEHFIEAEFRFFN